MWYCQSGERWFSFTDVSGTGTPDARTPELRNQESHFGNESSMKTSRETLSLGNDLKNLDGESLSSGNASCQIPKVSRDASKVSSGMGMRSIELFSGAGGLAIGTAEAGFHHVAVVEYDHDSCETIRLNQKRGFRPEWEVIEGDVRQLDYSRMNDIVFLAGGVPCQPFSLGGKHKAHEDERDMFPEFIRAVHCLKPKAFMIENVKGLLRQSFSNYFEYIILRLSHPSSPPGKNQTWRDHRAVLERIHTSGRSTDLDYNVVFQLLNAADYGVPQRRERVFIVGFRSDLGISWSFPEATHSREALIRSMWLEDEYWKRHQIPISKRPNPDDRTRNEIANLRNEMLFDFSTLPWRTVRDATHDLAPLKPGETDEKDPQHYIRPGARSYKGHSGSPLDEPAKTLKAGDHGVPGGENTLSMPDGSVRYFSVRECARIQSFPDEYSFSGSWTERMRQLGNAVPVALGKVVATEIAKKLSQI